MPFNRLSHSILGEIRPRFTLRIECDPEDALNQVIASLNEEKTVTGVQYKQTIFVKIPSWQQHYWSPEMTVRIERSEFSKQVLVHCLLGPRQSVWAMYTLIYAAILLLTCFGGMFGIVQYATVGSSPWIWLIPVGLIAFSSVFVTAKIGQSKGRDETLHLVSFLYHSLEKITKVERIEVK
jgi:hypothetical protein